MSGTPGGNLFVAVGLTDDTRHAIAHRLSEEGFAARIPGRRVKPQNWHLTLCFIGEASPVDQDRLAERIEAMIDLDAFKVTVGGFGGFPRPAKATVVYLEIIDKEDGLASLAATCSEAAGDVGMEVDDRRFVPHLTLSRVRPPQDIHRLVDAEPFAVVIPIDAVTMFRTMSERGGVRYEAVHRFPLAR